MSDYFDDIERQLRGAVRAQAHLPWYVRLRLRHSRALIGALACLVIGGPAIAYAAGAFQTGTPVGPHVPPIPGAFEGKALPSSVYLLSLRVPDPAGGPAWVLRAVKTTRGLECLQIGRFANGGIGVLGQDGAFGNDGRFHPLSPNLFEFYFGCGALDGAGHAFINEVDYGLSASALARGNTKSGGCYLLPVQIHGKARPVCPAADERDVYFGLLGPDAVSVTYRTASGGTATERTVGPDGAYLIVLRFTTAASGTRYGIRAGGETGGPTLEEIGASTPILTAKYTHGRACAVGAQFSHQAQDATALRKAIYARFPALAKAARSHHGGQPSAILRSAAYRHFLRAHAYLIPGSEYADPECQAVGYVAPKERLITSAEVKTPISARIEIAKSVCASPTEVLHPCGPTTPAGFTRVPARATRNSAILIVTWKTRVAVTNQDSHYEIYSSSTGASVKDCGGGTSFGPTESNLRVGQEVIFTRFMPLECPGISHGSVVFVQDTGPAGSIPVPAQPGEGPDIPVGKFTVHVP